jgi:hypothetical protein
MKTSSIALAGLVFGLTEAFKPVMPRATNALSNALGHGISPVPTSAPGVPEGWHAGLMKRAGGGSLLGYYAPDNTCGYVSGNLRKCIGFDVR